MFEKIPDVSTVWTEWFLSLKFAENGLISGTDPGLSLRGLPTLWELAPTPYLAKIFKTPTKLNETFDPLVCPPELFPFIKRTWIEWEDIFATVPSHHALLRSIRVFHKHTKLVILALLLILCYNTFAVSRGGSRIFPRGCANSQNCIYFSNFCRKLHENE